LRDDEVIRRVVASFVPVAVNLYKVRQSSDAGGELFRSVQRQKDQYQGIWIVSPGGEVLAGHHDVRDHSRWAQEVLATIDAALSEFGAVEPRQVQAIDPLPDRGRGIQSDGSVTAALYTRYVLGGGRATAPADFPADRLWLYDGEFRRDGPAVIDSITFSAEEWSSLTPPRMEIAAAWSVPEAVSAKFYRALSATSDQSHLADRNLKINQLRGKVEGIEGQRVRIRWTGQWETDHPYLDRRIKLRTGGEGIAIYDVDQQRLRSLLIVCRGVAFDGAAQPDRPTAAVIQWSYDRGETR
jgi:hypothetical protein